MTRLIHGQEALDQAIKISAALFSGEVKNLSAAEIKLGFKDVPTFERESKEDISLVDLIVEAKISPSKRQAREDIQNGAISINGEKVTDLQYVVAEEVKIEGEFILVRRGKKKYTLVK